MLRHLFWIVALISLLLNMICQAKPHQMAKPQQMILRMEPDQSSTINHGRLTKVKQFIIQKGQRTTYCNMYGNNPSYQTSGYDFFLNPDTGQRNIDCQLDKSDFNNLTIRKLSGGQNPYRTLDFLNPHYVEIKVPWASEDLTPLEARQLVEDALLEIQIEMSSVPELP